MEAHTARTWLPLLARGMLEDARHGLPLHAAVVGAEERAGGGAKPQAPRLVGSARLDVPRLLELQVSLLEEAELLGAVPRLAEVGRAVDAAAVDPAVRRRVDRPVPWISDGVEDVPALEEGAVDLEAAAVVAAAEEEQAFAGADEDQHGTERTALEPSGRGCVERFARLSR